MWDETHQTHGKTRGWHEDGLSSGRKSFLADALRPLYTSQPALTPPASLTSPLTPPKDGATKTEHVYIAMSGATSTATVYYKD